MVIKAAAQSHFSVLYFDRDRVTVQQSNKPEQTKPGLLNLRISVANKFLPIRPENSRYSGPTGGGMESRPTGRRVFYAGLLLRKAESDSTHLFDYFGTANLFPVALNPALRRRRYLQPHVAMLLAPYSLLDLLAVSVSFSYIEVGTELLAQPYPPRRTGESPAIVSQSVSYTLALGLVH